MPASEVRGLVHCFEHSVCKMLLIIFAFKVLGCALEVSAVSRVEVAGLSARM